MTFNSFKGIMNAIWKPYFKIISHPTLAKTKNVSSLITNPVSQHYIATQESQVSQIKVLICKLLIITKKSKNKIKIQ